MKAEFWGMGVQRLTFDGRVLASSSQASCRSMKISRLLTLLVAALLMPGCASTSSQQSVDKPPPKANRVQVLMYDTAPRAKTDHVDVFVQNPPERPYKIIALLTCEGRVDQEVVMSTAIYYRARQIGADGVVNPGAITTQREATVNVATRPGQQLIMNAIGIGGSEARSVFRDYAIVYTDK